MGWDHVAYPSGKAKLTQSHCILQDQQWVEKNPNTQTKRGSRGRLQESNQGRRTKVVLRLKKRKKNDKLVERSNLRKKRKLHHQGQRKLIPYHTRKA